MPFGNEYSPAGNFFSAVDFMWFVGELLSSSLHHLRNLFMSTRLLNLFISGKVIIKDPGVEPSICKSQVSKV